MTSNRKENLELRKLSYEDRLARLNLTILEERRIRGDMIETFKICNGYENIDANYFFAPNKSICNTRRHSKSLVIQRTRLEVRRNFFSQRVVQPWNKLNEDCVLATSVNNFKNRYDELMEERRRREESQPYVW